MQSCVTERSSGNVSGVGFTMSKSKIELSVKLVDARTGRIVQIKTASGHDMDKVMALNDSGCFKKTGMNVSIDEVCHAVADWLRDCFACPPKVLKVYEGEITVDLNENEVEEGDVFDVVDAKELGKDEDTGAWLGFDGKTIGSLAITRPGLRTSNAIPLEGESLSLENLDSSNHTYMLRRISKDSLKKRLRRKFANEH